MAIAILTDLSALTATVGKPFSFTFTGTSGAPVNSPIIAGPGIQISGQFPSGLSFSTGYVDGGGFWFITISGIPSGNLGYATGSMIATDQTASFTFAYYSIFLGLPSCSSSSSCPAKTVASGSGTSVRVSG